MSTDPEKTSHKQGGFTLLIGLILLIAISLVVIGTATTSFFQEKMAGAEITIHRDFEEAEKRLRAKEAELAALGAGGLTDNNDFAYKPCGVVNVTSDDADGTRVGGVTLKSTFYVPPAEGNHNYSYSGGNRIIICHPNVSQENVDCDVLGGTRDLDTFWSPPEKSYDPTDYDGTAGPNDDFAFTNCETGNKGAHEVSINSWFDNAAGQGHWCHKCDYAGPCGDGYTRSCRERFGNVPRRLSWTQVWDDPIEPSGGGTTSGNSGSGGAGNSGSGGGGQGKEP